VKRKERERMGREMEAKRKAVGWEKEEDRWMEGIFGKGKSGRIERYRRERKRNGGIVQCGIACCTWEVDALDRR